MLSPSDDSAAPIRDPAGAVSGAVLVFRDVTDRKRQEDALRRSEQRTRAILKSVTDAFFALGRDWRFTYVNREAERLLGRTRDDLLGKNILEEYAPAVGTPFHADYTKAMADGVAVTFEALYTPLGRWFEVNAYPSADGLSVCFRDVTERRAADEAVRASEARFRELADAMPQVVYVARPDGTTEYVNRRWHEYTGLPPGEPFDLARVIHPDDLPALLKAGGRGGPPGGGSRGSSGCGGPTASTAGSSPVPSRSRTGTDTRPGGTAPRPTSTTASGPRRRCGRARPGSPPWWTTPRRPSSSRPPTAGTNSSTGCSSGSPGSAGSGGRTGGCSGPASRRCSSTAGGGSPS